MDQNIHRILMTLGGIASGLGGLLGLTDYAVLNIPPEAGAVLSLIAAASIIVANTIRANWPAQAP